MKKERYFGLHFDFHAGNTAEIGTRTTVEDIGFYIEQAKIDFIQCDCKGHPGNASYFSKVGKVADNMKKDNLKIWVEAAKKYNLPIYMHYSGVIDNEYCKAHPECTVLNADGTPNLCGNSHCASVFSDYADKLLIPQLCELIDDYGVDGVWVDGDCWAVTRDFSENAKPYLHAGITEEEHSKIMRDGYIRYLKHYVDALHTHKKDFIVASNWAYTSYIPEKPEVDLDFLSGDFPSNNSVHVARYEARCICGQGKLWDLMAWGFEWDTFTDKPAAQLMQEAAMVVSLGGGFQVYITQNSDGSARQTASKRLAPLGEFMAQRKAVNFKKEPFAQTAVHYSAESRYLHSNIYNAAGATNALIGALDAVLDSGYTADILLDYQLGEKLSAYDIVYIPEWAEIGAENKEKFLAYMKNGGHLVVSGAETCRQFAGLTGTAAGACEELRPALAGSDGGYTALKKEQIFKLPDGEGRLYFNPDLRDTFAPAYKTAAFGKGSITFIPFSLGCVYFDGKSYILSEFLGGIYETLAKKKVSVNKPAVDVTLQKDGDGMLINLINLQQGRHSLNTVVYNYIPEICNLTVEIEGEYKSVTMPLGEQFTFEVKNGKTVVHLSELKIHSVICVK